MADGGSGSQWEDFEITKDEVRNITEALKKEEFRKLLVDYVEEVKNPENRKIYQEEITILERERGYDVEFINPEPGYVIKTSVDGKKKAFINVCKSDKLKKPTSTRATNAGSKGMNWSLPYSQDRARDDLDKSGKRCVVYDVVFHPDAHELARNNKQFKNMLTETALDAVENNFNVKLDRKNLRFPKIKYKGMVSNSVLRKKSENPPENLIDDEDLRKMNYPFISPDANVKPKETVEKAEHCEAARKGDSSNNTPYTSPTYIIKHRSPIDMQDYVNDKTAKINAAIPKELVIEIDLPLLSSSSDVTLDVTEESVALQSEKPAKYKLHINLPYKVHEESGNAKFHKDQRKLIITLPVRRLPGMRLADIGREDSGVESDTSYQAPEFSSGDDDSAETASQKSEENFTTEKPVSVADSSVQSNRTNIQCVTSNLDPDKHYLFPMFTCNVFDGVVAFTLHVKNVDPSSIVHHILKDVCGVGVQFMSIGSGHFPVYYAFCIKFQNGVVIQDDCLNIETWDNNVIMQIQLKLCDNMPTKFYAGTDEDHLTKHDIPDPAALAKNFGKLKRNACDHVAESCFKAEVSEVTDSSLVVEIKQDSNEQNDDNSALNQEELKVSDSDVSSDQKRLPPLTKSRTFSESSGEDISLSPRKGILKHPGRVCRSLSESSVDDYSWSSSLDFMGQSGGSDSCIPEEEEGEGTEHKKTVRFNDDISEKVYRNNSSILGQRKKNQRKIRNKKRAQERRASESENSECEAEKERDRESDDREIHIDQIRKQSKTESVVDSMDDQCCETEDEPNPSTSGLQHQNQANGMLGQNSHTASSTVSHIQLENDLIQQLSM